MKIALLVLGAVSLFCTSCKDRPDVADEVGDRKVIAKPAAAEPVQKAAAENDDETKPASVGEGGFESFPVTPD